MCHSPLWVIALFIALSEATAGISAITTNGTTRLIFAYFAVVFPVLIFAAFIWLLIRYTDKLYAPKDWPIEAYQVAAKRDEQQVLSKAIAMSIAPLLPKAVANREAAVEQVGRNFDVAVREQSVTVILDELKPGADELQIPVTERTRVDQFLNDIYFGLFPAVRAWTYGKSWTLEDSQGKVYSEMGTAWGDAHGLTRDTRRITEVGILPGYRMKVKAIPKNSKPIQ